MLEVNKSNLMEAARLFLTAILNSVQDMPRSFRILPNAPKPPTPTPHRDAHLRSPLRVFFLLHIRVSPPKNSTQPHRTFRPTHACAFAVMMRNNPGDMNRCDSKQIGSEFSDHRSKVHACAHTRRHIQELIFQTKTATRLHYCHTHMHITYSHHPSAPKMNHIALHNESHLIASVVCFSA